MKKNRTSYKEKLNINTEVKNETKKTNTKEYGVSGLSVTMGKPKEDVLKILQGPKRISLIEEMVKFDPTVGASDSLISSIASGVKFSIKAKISRSPDMCDSIVMAFANSDDFYSGGNLNMISVAPSIQRPRF